MKNFGSIWIILQWIIIINNLVLGEIQLRCSFTSDSETFWPEHKQCEISQPNLSNENERYRFQGSMSAMQEAKTVKFFSCLDVVEYIPIEIFQSFPTLNGLIIIHSKIKFLGADLFGHQNFNKIQYLNLEHNEIELIGNGAFDQMKKLKWINLSHNKLTSLDMRIFKENIHLKFISFDSNEIKSIHPEFFKGNKLLLVEFYSNLCISSRIGSWTGDHLIKRQEINDKFKRCFANYVETHGDPTNDGSSFSKNLNQNHLLEQINEAKFEIERKIKTSQSEIESLHDMNSNLKRQMNELKAEFRNMRENFEEEKENLNRETRKFKEESKVQTEKISKLEKDLEVNRRESQNVTERFSMENENLQEELKKIRKNLNDMEKEFKEKDLKLEKEFELFKIQTITALKISLISSDFRAVPAQEIKRDIESVANGEINMKTYRKAIEIGEFYEARAATLDDELNHALETFMRYS